MTNNLTHQKHMRDYSYDNLRAFLIFFVVFAHLLEIAAPFTGKDLLYNAIYSFHMPLFLFIFGYFSKHNPKRIIFQWVVPYVVFQTLYLCFSRFVLQANSSFQYTKPYWLLWYMLASIVYQLLLPVYQVKSRRKQILLLCISVCIALIAGFFDRIGYQLSLSRILVFQPWFMLGLYARKNDVLDTISKKCPAKKKYGILIISSVLILLSILFIHRYQIPSHLLYGSYSYNKCNQTVWMRAATMVIAFVWIVFLCVAAQLMLNKKMFLITQIGQNTLPVFLLHGFIVKAVPGLCPALVASPWRVLLLSCAIIALLGNKWCKTAVHYISGAWTENLFSHHRRT